MEKLSKLLEDYEDDNGIEFDEEEFEEEELEHTESFITRMTMCYNFLVDAIEYMPPSTSKEYKFKKDQDKARSFYLKLSSITKDFLKFLNRIKKVVGS